MAEILAPPKTVEVTFSLEPAYSAFASLSLLGFAKELTGLGEWVYRTAKALSPKRLRNNEIVLQESSVHLTNAPWPSFLAWVDDLEARDATEMRDEALQAQINRARKVRDVEIPTPAELLADGDKYLALIEVLEQNSGHQIDRSLRQKAHLLLNDPPTRHNLIVTHLRTMWDEFLAPEWERNQPLLEESIAAFESLNLFGLTANEALDRVFLRKITPDWTIHWLTNVENIIFIPSAHTGPYVLRLGGDDYGTERIAYGARIPEGARVSSSALSRSELLMRLNALANDTRLRILELLGQERELGTPEIMAQLELSQSAAWRHLEHLTATGYLTMRHHGGTKCYKLNPGRIERTFEALKEFSK